MRPIRRDHIPAAVYTDLERFRADTGCRDALLREGGAFQDGSPLRDLATPAEDFGRCWSDRATRGRVPTPEVVHASWSDTGGVRDYPALRAFLAPNAAF